MENNNLLKKVFSPLSHREGLGESLLGKGLLGLSLLLFTLLPFLTSCQESKGTVDEYDDWQNRNEAYFEKAYQQALYSSSSTMRVLPKWSLGGQDLQLSGSHTDYIITEVLESGEGDSSPLYTDSVEIHYVGRLMPSTSYPEGYVFDKSYAQSFDVEISPSKMMGVSNLTRGFATALMNMHRGDYWRITVPYQLGYGATASSTIPAYSTLIFEIRLVDFWSKGKDNRQ